MKFDASVFVGREIETVAPFKKLFFGLYERTQMIPFQDTAIPWLLLVLVGFLLWKRSKPWKTAEKIFFGTFLGLLHTFLCFRVGQGWDELFVNLKHSWVFSQTGGYSLNLASRIEGTVDFLPFFLAGILGVVGIPLLSSILWITLLGNFFFLFLLAKVLQFFEFSNRAIAWALLFTAFFPPLISVGATGFTCGLFCSFIFAGFYFELRNQSTKRNIFLSILPLIRFEGILFNFLFWLGSSWTLIRQRRYQDAVKEGAVLAGPFFLLSIWRLIHFGDWIPVPVRFKNTSFDLAYLKAGSAQLLSSFAQYQIYLILLPILFLFFYLRDKEFFRTRAMKSASLFTLCGFILTLTYHTGGGDWFPATWARYIFPFYIFIWTVFLVFILEIFRRLREIPERAIIAGVFLLIVFADGFFHPTILKDFASEIYKGRENNWRRVSHLAEMGDYFRRTTDSTISISSPEVGTIMYFAERDLVDLFGVASPEIARSPLNPLSPGDLTHRKRAPQLLADKTPEIIFLWGGDPTLEPEEKDLSPQAVAAKVQSSSMSPMYANTSCYRAGSPQYLEKIGYHYFIVREGLNIYSYYVHEKYVSRHKELLLELDFRAKDGAIMQPDLDPTMLQKFPDPEVPTKS